jgi:hypothetical protein
MRRIRQLPRIDPHKHRITHRRQHFPRKHVTDHPGLAPDFTFDCRPSNQRYAHGMLFIILAW